MPPQEPGDRWKEKYYNSLEELDIKERTWEKTESLLRTTIVRLCLAAEGVDRELDSLLDRLRRVVRNRDDDKRLTKTINDLNTTLDKLEAQKQQRSLTPIDVMLELLDAIEFPRGTTRHCKQFKKKLTAATPSVELPALINEFAQLFAQVFNLLEADEAPVDSSPGGGLLGKFTNKETREKKPASTTEDPAATTRLAKNILLLICEKLEIGEAQAQELLKLRKATAQAETEQEMTRFAAQLAQLVSTSLTADPIPEQDNMNASEVLLQLLERMELPTEHSPQVENLQLRLQNSVAEEAWPELLEDIANLLSRLKSHAQQEKKEIEEFLSQLTGRLLELDEYIQGMESDRKASLDGSRALDVAVSEQVRGINTSVQGATELSQLQKIIQERMQAISQHMERFRNIEEQRSSAAEQRIDQLTARLHNMESETSTLRDQVHQERMSAMRDPLTGLNNRLAYEDRLSDEFLRWKRYREPLSLLLFDIDFFKKINDNFGHQAGDKALCTIAGLLSDKTRETDFIARYGGEEFIVLMPGTNASDALLVAEKLREVVADCGFHYRDKEVSITVSCGISEFRDDDTPEIVFERADKALYAAKQGGRNQSKLGI